MPPRSRPRALLGVVVVLAACTTAPDPATPAAPASGGDGRQSPVPAGSEAELRATLLSLGDLTLAEMNRLGQLTTLPEASPEARAWVGAVRADVGTTATTLAVEPDPEVAMESLVISVSAKRLAASGYRDQNVPEPTRAAVVDAVTEVEKAVLDQAARWYSPAELDELRRGVSAWWNARSDGSAAGIVRIDDLGTRDAALSKGLFSPIREANAQLAEARQLGERFLFVVERLPMLSVWQAEAAAWNAAMAPEARQALADLSLMVAAMESLASDVERMPMTVAAEREAFLAAFDVRAESLGGLVGETRGVIVDAEPLLTSGVELATLAEATSSSLGESLVVFERLLEGLRDETAPGGAVSLDVEAYAGVVADLRAASESLERSLQRAEAFSSAPAAAIDRIALRAAQLLVLGFLLALGYRFAAPRLASASGSES